MVDKSKEALESLSTRYDKIQYLDSDGKLRSTKGTADAVAIAMLGMNVEQIETLARDNEAWDDKYITLNPGMVRMNIGNRLRNLVKKGGSIVIGDFTVTSLDQKIDNPAVKAAAKHLADKSKEAKAKEADKAKEAKAA